MRPQALHLQKADNQLHNKTASPVWLHRWIPSLQRNGSSPHFKLIESSLRKRAIYTRTPFSSKWHLQLTKHDFTWMCASGTRTLSNNNTSDLITGFDVAVDEIRVIFLGGYFVVFAVEYTDGFRRQFVEVAYYCREILRPLGKFQNLLTQMANRGPEIGVHIILKVIRAEFQVITHHSGEFKCGRLVHRLDQMVRL